jgi:hypothetical protein
MGGVCRSCSRRSKAHIGVGRKACFFYCFCAMIICGYHGCTPWDWAVFVWNHFFGDVMYIIKGSSTENTSPSLHRCFTSRALHANLSDNTA